LQVKAATALLLLAGGCGLGVGPYQPKRDAYATAGGARPDLHFDEAERRAEHQKAKQLRVRELGGGEAPMYAFDGGYYVGVKQGASQTRAGDGPWGSSVYAFEAHAGFFESVLRDHLVVGTSVFGVGYGTGGSPTSMSSARYVGAGLELAAKLGLTEKLSLRTAGGRLHGRATLEEAMVEDQATSGAWRAAAGIDWVVARLHGNDLVLTTEAQLARSAEVMLMGTPRHVDARALMFELVLVGI
jgi:hypothetical protein